MISSTNRGHVFASSTSSVSTQHISLLRFPHHLPIAQTKSWRVLHIFDQISLHPYTALLKKHVFCWILYYFIIFHHILNEIRLHAYTALLKKHVFYWNVCDFIEFIMLLSYFITFWMKFAFTLIPHFWKNMHFDQICVVLWKYVWFYWISHDFIGF
jgi:hypothetical protein